MLNLKSFSTEHIIYKKNKTSKSSEWRWVFGYITWFKIGYSYAQLTKNVIKWNTIILLWEEYRCMHVLIRVNISLIILYQKINDCYQGYEFIITSIWGFLNLTKGHWRYHVKILEFTLLIQKAVNRLSKIFRLVILSYETG